MGSQFIHPLVEPIILKVLQQFSYPELYKLSAFLSDDYRPYWDMYAVQRLPRETWEAHQFHYPPELTDALVDLEDYYDTTMKANPDSHDQHTYYNSNFVLFFFAIIERHKEFVLNLLESYLARTKGHQETFYNRKADEEQHGNIVGITWNLYRSLWFRSAT